MADDTTSKRQTLTLVRDRTNDGAVQPAGALPVPSEVAGGLVQPEPGSVRREPPGHEPTPAPTSPLVQPADPLAAAPVEVEQVVVEPVKPEGAEPTTAAVAEPTSFIDVLGSDHHEPVADPEPAVGSAPGPAPAEPVQVGPLEFFGRAKRGRVFRR